MKFSIHAVALLAVMASALSADPAPVKPADPKAAPVAVAAPVALAAPVTVTAKPPGYQVEMKSYRWRKHPRKNYERLVLEFNRKDKGGGPIPVPSVVPAASGKDSTIVVGGVSLTGNTDEGKVSDSYGSKSAFLNPLSILVDANNGFSVKLNFKKSDVVAEAMWLDSPSRLVIDVFASVGDRNAIRATAPDNADSDEKVAEAKPAPAKEVAPAREPVAEKKAVGTPNDTVAAAPAVETRSLFATPPAPAKKPRARRTAHQAAPAALVYPAPVAAAADPRIQITTQKEEFLCFPANAQVGLSVFFAPKNRRGDKEEVRLDIQNTNQKVQTASNIVCYPASAQVEASISFRDEKALGKTDDNSGREPASRK